VRISPGTEVPEPDQTVEERGKPRPAVGARPDRHLPNAPGRPAGRVSCGGGDLPKPAEFAMAAERAADKITSTLA
jgi:hypothetical protein